MSSNSRETGGHIGSLFDNEAAVDEFFSPAPRGRGALVRLRGRERPRHYRSVNVTLYTEDVERLEALLLELKRRGHTRANKSLVIREALRQLDPDLVPAQR